MLPNNSSWWDSQGTAEALVLTLSHFIEVYTFKYDSFF